MHHLMLFGVPRRIAVRTTITIDDELLQDAKEYSGIGETSELVRKALRDLVAREAGRRLAALGGTMPGFQAAPRRRPDGWPNSE
jgi:Arc/MetJ family transcription regulator